MGRVPGVIEVGRVLVSPEAQPTESRLWPQSGASGLPAWADASGAKAEPIDGDSLGGCAAGALWGMPHRTPSRPDRVRSKKTPLERVVSLGMEVGGSAEDIAKFAAPRAPALGVLGGAIMTSEVG